MKNKLPKIICLLLAITLSFCVTGCNKKGSTKKPKKSASKSNSSVWNSAYSNEPIIDDEDEIVEPEEDEEDDAVTYEVLPVQNGSTPINSNFGGFGGVHMSFAYMPDGSGANRLPMEQWQAQMEYDRIAGSMRVGRIRTLYGPGMVWNYQQQKFEWDPEKNAALKGFYKGVEEWQKRGVEVVFSPVWALSHLLANRGDWKNTNPKTVDYTTFVGCGITEGDDYEKTLKNFRKFVCDTVLNFKANGIHNAKYLTAFTECNLSYQYISAPEGTAPLPEDATARQKRHYDILCEKYAEAVKALDAGLRDSGLRSSYKIVGPCDNFARDFEYTDPEQYSILTKYTLENLSDYVDIIGTHQYSYGNDYSESLFYENIETTLGKTVQMAKAKGKEIWLDEYNASLNGDIKFAQRLITQDNPIRGIAQAATHLGALNSGFDHAILWALSDVQWPNTRDTIEFQSGLQAGGLLRSPLVSTVPYKPWYAISLITRYTGAGTVYQVEQGTDLYISCVKRNDGHYTVIMVNYSVDDVPVQVQFEKGLGRKTFYRHTYNSGDVVATTQAKIIGVSRIVKNVSRNIHDTLPGYSVTVYTTDPS